jgi:hypothetical protein
VAGVSTALSVRKEQRLNSRATITHAKVGGSEYGRESLLTLTLDVRLPTPVEVRSLPEWAGSELDWQTRQQIAKAQQQRASGKKNGKLTKAEKKAQEEAHAQGEDCPIVSCETCNPDASLEALMCLEHRLPWQECQQCDGEGAIFLDEEDVKTLSAKYERYVQEQKALNQEALLAAQEAAMFLLLIKKPVHVSIAPAQQAFADLLQLTAPSA